MQPMPASCSAAGRCARWRPTCAGSARCAIVTASWKRRVSPPACSIIPRPASPGSPTRLRRTGLRSRKVRWCWPAPSFARSRPARATRSRPTMDRMDRSVVTSPDVDAAKRSDPDMPHFTIEYSANLNDRVDIAKVVEIVRKAAVETGIFPLGGIRVRAIPCEHFAIADGSAHFGFLDMVLRLGEGRDLATRKTAGEHIFKALSGFLDPVFAASEFALSFDMQINDKETSWKRNNIHEALKAEAIHGYGRAERRVSGQSRPQCAVAHAPPRRRHRRHDRRQGGGVNLGRHVRDKVSCRWRSAGNGRAWQCGGYRPRRDGCRARFQVLAQHARDHAEEALASRGGRDRGPRRRYRRARMHRYWPGPPLHRPGRGPRRGKFSLLRRQMRRGARRF